MVPRDIDAERADTMHISLHMVQLFRTSVKIGLYGIVALVAAVAPLFGSSNTESDLGSIVPTAHADAAGCAGGSSGSEGGGGTDSAGSGDGGGSTGGCGCDSGSSGGCGCAGGCE